ncbi:MAG TPA: ABC transporter permease [Acidobacteriaceae bacterium]|nr:ABC transporter permease [Acidobacteriaceae bacterium]
MHNIWLIAKREYMERVRTKGFILATVLIPCFMAALVGGSAFFMTRTKTSSHIAVVTSDRTLGQDIKHQLETGKNSEMTVDVMQPSGATRSGLDTQLHTHSSQLAGYLWITPSPQPGQRPHFEYHARSAGDISTEDAIENGLRTVLTREGLLSHGLTSSQIDEITAPVDVDTSSTGNSALAFGIAYLFFFLMYMVIMLYGMNTARSIIEEKTSRVFEVLLATIKPDELLAGKIIGVGAVGVTQVVVWMIAAAALASSSMVAHLAGTNSVHGVLSASQIGFFVLYFIFGFLLYSAIAAALGAMTNSEQELQQLNMFLVLPLAFCMVMLFPTVRAPDSTLSQVISLIPFCSPLLMNFRTALTSVPAWQIILSVVLMSITIGVVIWISSRIYRVGILMYGKRPNLPEILRWLRYS